jgi:pimeloyl-ACP methyl ester carboxylesterase
MDCSIQLPDGMTVAFRSWGSAAVSRKLLCLHGWLDNAASFDRICPILIATLSIHIVALDFCGHGLSSHRPKMQAYTHADRVILVRSFVQSLGWTNFVLMGHSMGANVAVLFAGAFPELVTSCILIDGLMYPRRNSAPNQIREYFNQRSHLLERQRRTYPSRSAAVARYSQNNPNMPLASVEILVARGTDEIEQLPEDNMVISQGQTTGSQDQEEPALRKRSTPGCAFRHDPRLSGTSLFSFSDADTAEFAQAICCPVLLLVATRGVIGKLLEVAPKLNLTVLKSTKHAHAISAVLNFNARERASEVTTQNTVSPLANAAKDADESEAKEV